MSRSQKYFVLLALTLLPAIAVAQRGGGAGQPASAGPFGALRWRSLGPARGGRSIAVAGSEARPYEYYMGATGGGLWKTTDAGIILEAGHRRADQPLVGRRGRRLRLEPRRRLHRHRRGRHPRQHHPGRRRVQVDRRRQDVDAHRPRRHAGHRQDPRPPDEPGSRLRRGVRPPRGAESRSRRLPVEGRRQDLGEDPVPRQQDRRERAGDRSEQPAGDLRRAVGGVPERVRDVERRPRQRHLQVDRRRRSLDRDLAQPRAAESDARQDRPLGVRRRLEPRLRADRSGGRRLLPVRRCRRDVEEGERAPRSAPARVLLLARLRRSQGEGHRLGAERQHLQVDRRRQDVEVEQRAARRQPRHVDRVERLEPDDRGERRRRHDLGQRRRDVDAGADADRAVLSRDHDQARAVSHLRRAAGQQHRVRVERAGAGRPGRIRRRRGPGVLLGRRRRERLHRERSAQPRHLLRRQLRRPDHAARSPHRPGARGQPVPGQPDGVRVGRHRGALPVDVPDRDGADRPADHLRRLAARVEVHERRPELGEDQPGPHAPRSEDDGRVGRSDHEGQHRRRDLRDGLQHRAVGEGRQRHLGRIRRRLRAGDAQRRHQLEERHAEGAGRLRAHQPDRSVAVPRRHRLRRGEPLSAGRLQALRLPHRRLRRDLDGDHERRRRRPTSRAPSARTSSSRSCCISAPSTASTSRSTTARSGSRCGRTCRTRRSTTSRSRSATS